MSIFTSLIIKRFGYLIVCLCLTSLVVVGQIYAQAHEPDPLLLKPPTSKEEVAPRIAMAQAQIEQLQAEQPSATSNTNDNTQTPDPLSELKTQLITAWKTYLEQLQRLQDFYQKTEQITSEKQVLELAAQIEDIQKKTTELTNKRPPLSSTQPQIDAIQTTLTEISTQILALDDKQKLRTSQLKDGLNQQRQQLETELNNIRQQRTGIQSTAPEAGTAEVTAQQKPQLNLDTLTVKMASLEAALQVIPIEQKYTDLVFKQDERYLQVLQTYKKAIEDRIGVLKQTLGKSSLDTLEQQRLSAILPHQIAYIDLQIYKESVLLNYFTSPQADRFTQAVHDTLVKNANNATSNWQTITDSLQQRTGQHIMELRSDLKRERIKFLNELTELRSVLVSVYSDLRELQRVQNQASKRFGVLADHVSQLLEAIDETQRTQYKTNIDSLQAEFTKQMSTVIADRQQLITRLQETIKLLDDSTAQLARHEHTLYWTALRRRESGLIGTDWSGLGKEFRQFFSSTSLPTYSRKLPDTIASDELLAKRDLRSEIQFSFSFVRTDFLGAKKAGYLYWAITVVGAVVLAIILHRIGRTRSRRAPALSAELTDKHSESPSSEPLQVRQRVHLFGWNLLRDASIPSATCAALLAGIWILHLTATTALLLSLLAGFLFVPWISLVIVRNLFEPHNPGERVVPCGDNNAAFYCHAFKNLLVALFMFGLPYALFKWIDVAPAIRTLLWESLKTILLLMLIIFWSHRRHIVTPFERQSASTVYLFISALYPFVLLSLIALLILQIIGYGVLVEFISQGLLYSAMMIVFGAMLAEYLCEALEGLIRRDDKCDKSADARITTDAEANVVETLSEALDPATDAHSRQPSDQSRRNIYYSWILKAVLRLAAAAIAFYLILVIWGYQVDQIQVNWRNIGLVAASIFFALLLDRLVEIALHSFEAKGRLPLTASIMIRRCVKGLLVIVVLFIVVGYVGLRIDDIWTLITTLLAMVAIGFVAVWSILSNITSTFIILIWRPFNIGEFVDIQPEGITGKITDINFMYTIIKGDGGELVHIPNSLFVQKFIKHSRRKLPAKHDT